jgi:hypothetical protein
LERKKGRGAVVEKKKLDDEWTRQNSNFYLFPHSTVYVYSLYE